MTRDAPVDSRTADAADAGAGEARAEIGGLPAIAKLPAVAPAKPGRRRKRGLKRRWLLLLVLPAAIFAGYRWFYSPPAVPAGISFGNGRLEADQIDIDTKFAGRIAKLFVDEGDLVAAGEVVAAMDTRDFAASLKKSEALVDQAQRALDEAKANLAQQQTQVVFAKQQLDRAEALVPKGFATVEQRDQRRQQLAAARAAENAATERVHGAEYAVDAATHDVELYRVNILDSTLVAPREGRIEYRVANVGEVLPAGGKVFTMLDTSYVYMDIYLPTADAGRVRLGSDARIVLDAYPTHVIPAKVVFVASQAQFTPKTVETKDERDKLMFRVRVRIDPERLHGRAEVVRSGLPGVAYVRTDPHAAWPAQLLPSPPP
jgi:HlyD family secretion protein